MKTQILEPEALKFSVDKKGKEDEKEWYLYLNHRQMVKELRLRARGLVSEKRLEYRSPVFSSTKFSRLCDLIWNGSLGVESIA